MKLLTCFFGGDINQSQENSQYSGSNIKHNPSQCIVVHYLISLNNFKPMIQKDIAKVKPIRPYDRTMIGSSLDWKNPNTNEAKISLPISRKSLASSSIWRSFININGITAKRLFQRNYKLEWLLGFIPLGVFLPKVVRKFRDGRLFNKDKHE